MRVHGTKYVLALAAGAGLAFASGSQAAGHRQVRCGRGYVRHSVRVPERRHDRIVRRHGRIVYVHVARCVKSASKPEPQPTPTPPAATTTPVAAAPPPLPVPTVTTTTTATTPADTTTTATTLADTTTTATTATDTTSTSTTTTPPPPAYGGTCSTPVPGASQTVGANSYALEGMDTFTKDAPIGSFAQTSIGYPDGDSLPVVYTGDQGMGWTDTPITGHRPTRSLRTRRRPTRATNPRPSSRSMTGSSTSISTTTRTATRSAQTRRRCRMGTAIRPTGRGRSARRSPPPTQTTWRTSTRPRCSGPRTTTTTRRRNRTSPRPTSTPRRAREARGGPRTRTTQRPTGRTSRTPTPSRRRCRTSTRRSGMFTRRSGVRHPGPTTSTASWSGRVLTRCGRTPSAGSCRLSRRSRAAPGQVMST